MKRYRYFLVIPLAFVVLFFLMFVPIRIIHSPLIRSSFSVGNTPPGPIPTSPSKDGYLARTFIPAPGQSLLYYLYIPSHYDPHQKYPLVLLLHGSGESYNAQRTPVQNQQILFHASYVRVWSTYYSAPGNPAIQQRWPCFVVVPQANASEPWVNTDDRKGSYKLSSQPALSLLLTKELLDALQHEYPSIDAHRLYITGISSGGYGTWDAIERWPHYFAAAAPIAGAGDPSKAAVLVHLPIWVFHGAKDPTVPISSARDMVKAIRAAGGTPRYTEFANAGHGVWGRVYSLGSGEPVIDFFPWLFSQHT